MNVRDRRRRPEVDDMSTAGAVRKPPHALLDLQRSLGNQGVVSMLARNRGKKAPPKPIDIDVDDAAGTIKSTTGEQIGFRTADKSWYATAGAAAATAARLGDLETSAGKLPILKVKKSTVTVGA